MNIVVHFCDRCSASIPEKDVADKAAFIQGGLTLCSTCRRALGGVIGDPEIFFFEGCGRSISVPELEVGSVRVVTDRLLCMACLPASAPPAPVPQPETAAPRVRGESRGGMVVVLAVVGLLAACSGGIALFVPAVRSALETRGFVSKRPVASDAGESAARHAASATSEEVRDLRLSVERLGEAVRALSDKRSADDGDARLGALESRLLEASRADSESISSLEGSIGEFAVLLGELRGEIDAVKMLASIPSGDVVGQGGDAEPDAPVATPDPKKAAPSSLPPSEPSASPDRDRWISELSASDSGRRFTAIVELARLRDPAAVPELGKTLANDPDVYCRTEAGRTLGEFRDFAAVPFLIASLRDREGMVAITAAESLKLITSKSFGFTSKATPQERREAISRWESWWEKNKDTVPGSGASKH